MSEMMVKLIVSAIVSVALTFIGLLLGDYGLLFYVSGGTLLLTTLFTLKEPD